MCTHMFRIVLLPPAEMWAPHVSSFFNTQPRTEAMATQARQWLPDSHVLLRSPSGRRGAWGGAGYSGEEFGEGQRGWGDAGRQTDPLLLVFQCGQVGGSWEELGETVGPGGEELREAPMRA
jgi:hypothetical protein